MKQERPSADPNREPGARAPKANFRLGDLLIVPGTQQVFRGGTEIALPKLSFDLLLALIRAAPNTVTLDELMDRVWPGLVVGAETVTQRVKLLRDALGDDSQAPRYIGLVRGRGYRLLVSAVQETEPDPASTGSSGRREKAFLFGGLLVAVAAVALFLGTRGNPPSVPAEPPAPSLAVLPFATLSPDAKEQDYFAAGVHDDLLTRLAQVESLKVISRSSVMEYRDSLKNLRQIASELGVANVLEGSVQQMGNRVRINVQLIDAVSDAHLWAQTYDRELTVANLFDIQADIARAIASALQLALLPEQSATLTPTSTADLEAYRLYLTANGYRQRWGSEGKDELLSFAEDHYRRAIGLDPDFALAHAALAQVLVEIYWHEARPGSSTVLDEARAASERALALVPNLPEGHLALGTYYYYGFRDYEHALEEIALAERRMPGNSEVHGFKAYIFRRQGRVDDAVASYQRALQLAPVNPMYLGGLGGGLMRQQRFEEAEALFRRHLEIGTRREWARHSLAHLRRQRDGDFSDLRAFVAENVENDLYLAWWLAWTDGDYAAAQVPLDLMPEGLDAGEGLPRGLLQGLTDLYAGESTAARAEFQRTRELLEPKLDVFNPANPGFQYRLLALSLAGLGEKEAAIAAGRQAMELMPANGDAMIAPGSLVDLATVYAMVGETQLAISTLEQALLQPYPPDLRVLERDPRLKRLLNDPAFRALAERYGARVLGDRGPSGFRQDQPQEQVNENAGESRRKD